MMQMNIERMINATGSLLIWLVMILAAVIFCGTDRNCCKGNRSGH